MRDIRRFIIPVDFSDASKNAVKYAAEIAHDFANRGVQCHLVHASESKEDESMLSVKMDSFVTNISELQKVDYHSHIVRGDLESAMTNLVAQNGDLVIMGTAGDDGREISTSADFISKFDSALLLVPEKSSSKLPKKIALCIDNKKIDDASALKPLNDLAKWFDMSVHLLMVANEKEVGSNVNDETLEYYLQTIAYNHHIVINSDIEEGILNYVHENEIDMLAILPRTHAISSEPSEGKLTQTLAMHTDRPMLVLD